MTPTGDFWTRRKAAVEAEAEAEVLAERADALREQREALDGKTDAEILAELDLPDPDSLELGDDVSRFMTDLVPDRLRRRALRRLWRINPVLANVDGLVDYGEDYTDAACVVENLQTAYQVGKGMLAHVEALVADSESTGQDTAEDESGENSAETPEHQPLDTAAQVSPGPEAALAAEAGDEAVPGGDPEEPAPPPPHRMRFVFEG